MVRLIVWLFALIAAVCAFPLTVDVAANDVECFYGEVARADSLVGLSYSVQSGGSFDIDFRIKAPNGQVIYEQLKEREGEYAFTARLVGEYQFCFSNDMSTFSDKQVEFDLNIDSALKAQLPPSVGQGETESVERTISLIEDRTNNILRQLHYYKTRNNRNESTVKSTGSRIFWFSIFEVLLMAGMSVLQVTIVQLFFTGSRKQLV
ncbi:protein Erp2p [Trichomonascus vanleenenianus]|uniref:emp24/gp25L/p24 family protein n=1 Tax=Trichomonascus vanleenenianus TaxID=2268995 RepID=UPI003ECA056D